MSNTTLPEKFLEAYVDLFNKGNIGSILTLYESDASFASQPGQVVKVKDSIRGSLQTLIEMKGKLESNVKRVLKASDIALVISLAISPAFLGQIHIMLRDRRVGTSEKDF